LIRRRTILAVLPISLFSLAAALASPSESHSVPPGGEGGPAGATSEVLISPDRASDVAYWTQAVAGSPDDVTLRLALGNALNLNRRYAEAVGQYRRAIKGYPVYKEAWNNLGSAYRAMGKMSAALDAYRKASEIDPHYALAYYNIGTIYDTQGYYERSVKYYGLALRYDPRLASSKFNPQVVSNQKLLAASLRNYVETKGTLALPLEPAYPSLPNN
jgi:tetratricopeptide (TPR) repeat protein